LVAAAAARGGSLLDRSAPVATGSVVFVHPDGSGVAHWGAARMWRAGPDGRLHWDRVEHLGVYRGHLRDALASTSHGGGTVHAYGVKVPADSFGMDGRQPLVALSGKPMSVMQEALAAGKAAGIVNSGNLNEPGTGVFLASVPRRDASEDILRQIVRSGAQVILGGGEMWLLPKGARGRHGEGARMDGLDLVAEARSNGYAVVYTRAELAGLPPDTRKVLGVFAVNHTFHDLGEEELRARGLPLYEPEAPAVAEMTAAALAVLGRHAGGFLLVVEEEGNDNFSNYRNARGALEALGRADDAIGVVREYRRAHPQVLLLTAADSDASGLEVIANPRRAPGAVGPDAPLPPATTIGAPLDGRDGAATPPFLSAPDEAGRRHPFAIAWTSMEDTAGGIVARAEGPNAACVRTGVDNTDVYRLLYATLFGRWPDAPAP